MSSLIDLKNPLMVALDVDSPDGAVALAEKLQGKVGAFKVGPRLAMKAGEALIARLNTCAPVFVDNKYLDIPNTMEASVRATFEAGASFCTVHAWAGKEALERLAKVEVELNQKRPFQILVVTILTSFTEKTLPPTMVKEPIDVHVRRLTMLAADCGLSGFVCSPFEVAALKQEWPQGFFVTPGVRIESIAGDDQKRVKTPQQAVKEGAGAIVVGRPIVAADDPVAACERILAELSS